MLVFVDESGDPGLNTSEGSSKHFIITLIIFEDHEEAEAADLRISLLRKELSLPSNFEFHFHSNKPNTRKAFLQALSPYNFFYFGIVINKTSFGSGLAFPESFYKYVSGLVFENAKGHLRKAIVVFDKCGNKTFQGQLSQYLKRKMNEDGCTPLIKKVKTEHSNRNNLLQLADMVCGSVNRYCSSKDDREDYRKLISHREIFVQFWPK